MASKYDALTGFLRGKPDPVVELSFADLDRIVPGGMAASARKHPAWWANSRVAHDHARYWLDAGRTAHPDFNGGRVRFALGAENRRGPNAVGSPADGSRARAPLTPTGEVVDAAVRFEWREAGCLTMEGGRPKAPRVPAVPGIYRFSFVTRDGRTASVYVGETDNLQRRMAHYRNPGPTQTTNQRLHARMVEHMEDGGRVELAVTTEVTSDGQVLDLRQKAARLLTEREVVAQLVRRGVAIENR